MILAELAEKYRNKMPGCDLVGEFEAGVPVYKIQLKANAQKYQQVPVIPQFVLRLIELGINSDVEIAQALGIGPEFVRKALGYLDHERLISQNFEASRLTFITTDRGKRALHEAITAMYSAYFDIQVDGFTRKISSLDMPSLHDGPNLKKNGAHLLNPTPKARPTLESLHENLSDLELIFRDQLEDLNTKDRLIEILDIGRPRLMYKPVNVLVFRDRVTKRLYLRVFEGYFSISEYEQILMKREQDGNSVIPEDLLVPAAEAVQSELTQKLLPEINKVEQIHQQIQDYEAEKESLQASLNVLPEAEQPTKDIVTGKTKRIEELETEVQKLRALSERDKPVRGNEHRQILKDALTSAQQIVMIISPWIRQDSVDREISGLIQKAIERGVIILIGYGMPLRSRESKEDYLDESVAKAFEKIKKGPNGNKLKVEWLGNTHEKILVCDRSFCVVTSFNWLSYRGDKGFRKEMGTYFENPKMVQEVTDDVLKRFKSAPTNS